MNCIPETEIPSRPNLKTPYITALRQRIWAAASISCIIGTLHACGVSTSESATQTSADRNQYRMEFIVIPDRVRNGARVKLQLAQSHGQFRQLRMRIDPDRISDVRSDNPLRIDGDLVTWTPAPAGGSLEWFATLRHARKNDGYDAFIDANWAVFRAEDIIPRASTRTLKGATSETWFSFRLPPGWSSITPYFGHDQQYRVDNPKRRFDLPAGWMALGRIGVRNETIDGVRVNVAAPEGHDVRRMDILALLHWTLPEARRLLPDFPDRLTVIGGADPMWRGGLSGPQSLFIHASRPLISENATSTLLHEVFHVGFGPSASANADWIIEGLAEYYSLQLLARGGSISQQRLSRALATQAQWGKDAEKICVPRASGPVTARSVAIFAALDSEIRKQTDNRHSLDDVTRALATSTGKIGVAVLRRNVSELIGRESTVLAARNLPGCSS